MKKFRWFSLLTVLAMLLTTVAPLAASPDVAPSPQSLIPALAQVNVAGSFEDAIGGANWSNNDALTDLADANTDGVWKFSAAIPPAGTYEYKIVEDGDWGKGYPAGNVPFTVTDGQTVKWYYDPADHYVADSANKVIAAAVGNFPSKIGGADWAQDNLKTLLKGPDAEGKYAFRALNLPAGSYEYKVALNEGWAEAYPGDNKAFTVPAGGGDVKFTFDPVTKAVSEEVLPPTEPPPPPPPATEYAVIHYNRPAADYTGWGLHLWGDALAPSEGTTWDAPKAFSGTDAYGAYVAIKLKDKTKPINYIIHKGNDKDTPNDRSFNPGDIPVLWLKQGDGANYASQAAIAGKTIIHYHRADGDYTGWGLHLWGDAIDPTEATDWGAPKLPTGTDDYGAYFEIKLKDPTKAVNFLVHKGDSKDPDGDRSYTPATNTQVWLQSGDAAVYKQRGAAEDYAVIHYRRLKADYDGWGLHLWGDSAEPGITWGTPFMPTGTDSFGVLWKVRLTDNPVKLNYIAHKGDEKDPGPDEALVFAQAGFEIWKIQGSTKQYTDPAIAIAEASSKAKGDLTKQKATHSARPQRGAVQF